MARRSPSSGIGLCFFQAEDGIRDIGVTGVQTCALPISAVLACVALRGISVDPDDWIGTVEAGVDELSAVELRAGHRPQTAGQTLRRLKDGMKDRPPQDLDLPVREQLFVHASALH